MTVKPHTFDARFKEKFFSVQISVCTPKRIMRERHSKLFRGSHYVIIM